MSKPLTERDLAQIEAAVSGAIPGPWTLFGNTVTFQTGKWAAFPGYEGTAHFIAVSRDAVPALLEHVQFLEENLRAVQAEKDELELKFETLTSAIKAIELPARGEGCE